MNSAHQPQLADRRSIGDGLPQAVERREFIVQLQPVVALPTRQVTGFEALVRWAHPRRGVLAPAAFLPAAVHSGWISTIDRIVLQEAIALLGRHRAARPIAVNLSAQTLGEPDLAGWLRAHLANGEVAAERLLVEVTEAALIGSADVVATRQRSLRDLGLGVVIDGVGVHPEPVRPLSLRPEGLKIDRSLIARLLDDPRAETIVDEVFRVAESLDAGVVAAGIELDEHVDRLLAISGRYRGVPLRGQGFLFGRPADADVRLAGFVEVLADAATG